MLRNLWFLTGHDRNIFCIYHFRDHVQSLLLSWMVKFVHTESIDEENISLLNYQHVAWCQSTIDASRCQYTTTMNYYTMPIQDEFDSFHPATSNASRSVSPDHPNSFARSKNSQLFINRSMTGTNRPSNAGSNSTAFS